MPEDGGDSRFDFAAALDDQKRHTLFLFQTRLGLEAGKNILYLAKSQLQQFTLAVCVKF